ncbi:MAG: amino acid permease [Opitutaceae bacterium]|nr:amino acid permease [Opitutaceae bacterium]
MSGPAHNPPSSGKPELVRAIGRWTLTALVLNGIIGSGIFGLPSTLAKQLGPLAPWAYVIGAAAIGAIVGVFAELASQFRETGGQYLYARVALGRFAGIQIGWFSWLVRLTSAAAVANLFVVYLGEFWSGATAPGSRAVIITGLVAVLVFVNYRSVRGGAGLSNFFTVAKLVPLVLFVLLGVALVPRYSSTPPVTAPAFGAWVDALVAMMFAFGGFEAAVIPAAEAKDPRRDAPFALGVGLALVTAIYVLVHLVTMWAVPDLANSSRPLADAARTFAGPVGAGLIAAGAMLSTFGWLTGAFVTAPRLTHALAEAEDFPRIFAKVHPHFRTPYISILLWAALVLLLALYGNFIWNAVLAAAARLVTYASSCLAFIRLRQQRPQATAFRVPGGLFMAGFGLAFCALLITRMNADHAQIITAVGLIATVNWLAARYRAKQGTGC